MISGQGGSGGIRSGGPEPGLIRSIQNRRKGLEIEVKAPGGTRQGIVPWRRLGQWIALGLDPYTRDAFLTASSLETRLRSSSGLFYEMGETHLNVMAEKEVEAFLRELTDTITERALQRRQAGSPLQKPVRRSTLTTPEPTALSFDVGDAVAPDNPYAARMQRLHEIAAVFPDRWYDSTPLSQVQPGCVLRRSGHLGGLYRVSQPGVDHGEYIEFTGELIKNGKVVTDRRYKSHVTVDVQLLPQSLQPLFDLDQQCSHC
ncbi:hypothetical protein ACFQX6_67005 [Streptosporangium lutulentum]